MQIEPGSLPSEFPATQFEPQPASAPSGPQTLDIRFTGSGSEYFRIWIVNLLLTVVTLSLYLPFAKARRLAYFQGNTLVGGHALGFHGDPWKMFRGYLLVLALGITYSVASRISPVAALVAVGALAAVWPALWRASLQFRTANTSWRGVRLRFTGSLNDAYNAMLPVFLPAVLITVLTLSGAKPGELDDLEQVGAARERTGMLVGLIMLAAVVAIPWLAARVKRYQHSHYAYASEQTWFSASAAPFYGLWFKSVGVSILTMLGALAAGAVLVIAIGGVAVFQSIFSGHGGFGAGAGAAVVLAITLGAAVFYLAMFAIPGPYVQSRFQNLLWGHTASPHIQFRSDLRLVPLAKRTVINLLLTIITLGLYRPFAAVAMAKLRLEAVSLDVDGNVDDWVNTQNTRMDDATGDLAGDFFGIDLGL